MPAPELVLTLSCPDRRGIVHAVSRMLDEHQGNILDSQQFRDPATETFFMRVHFALEGAPTQRPSARPWLPWPASGGCRCASTTWPSSRGS